MVKVVILCGGKGTRLAEETRITPKPLVTIGGIPMVSHIINQYLKYGYSEFILATGYKSENFSKYFSKKNSAKLLNDFSGQVPIITIFNTGLDTLTGGRVLRLKELLANESEFMLTYGDGIANINISDLVNFHKAHKKLATVTAVHPPARFGVIRVDDHDRVEYFQEKNQTDSGWINGGFFIFKKEIFNYLINDETVLEDIPLRNLTLNGELMAFKHRAFWQCMDTLRDREFLEELWSAGGAPWK